MYEKLDKEYLLRTQKEPFRYACLTKRKKQFYIVSEKGRLVHLLSALPPAILLILIAGGYLLSAGGCYLWSVRIMERKEF